MRVAPKETGELKLFYLSRIAKVKNLHYALDVLSKIKTEGRITYDIYGSLEDKTYWKECETIIKKLPSNIKVNYKGLVIDRVETSGDLAYILYHFQEVATSIKTNEVVNDVFFSAVAILKKSTAGTWKIAVLGYK